MKTLTALLLTLTILTAKSQSALELGTASQVRNSIIFQNPDATLPVSTGVSVTFSASDLALPTGNNVNLPVTPFSDGFRIDMGSLVFDRGSETYLNATDTLDLDFNPRISCRDVDIGAFEFQVPPTEITVQPTLASSVCEGSDVFLTVEATGKGLLFQWQRNGVNLGGANPSPDLSIRNVSMADTGYFRVIVFGACCNDTSDVVRVDVDLMPMVIAMSDTAVLWGSDLILYYIEATGTVRWFYSDLVTEVADTHLRNINLSQEFFAVATSGACADTIAVATVTVLVYGYPCVVATNEDAIVCAGDPFRLLINYTVLARSVHWFLVGDEDNELPNGALVRPLVTSEFILIGLNSYGEVCGRDTLTLTVPVAPLEVRADITLCVDWALYLYSIPPADHWFDENNNVVGEGNIEIVPPAGRTNLFIAQLAIPDTDCFVRDTVSVTVNPPDLTMPFANHIERGLYRLTVCEADLIHLHTNIEPIFIDWRTPDDQSLPEDPTIAAATSGVFRAWAWDEICGDVYIDLELTVMPLPDFGILPKYPILPGATINLTSIPNTPVWTDIYGARVFMPLTVYEDQAFIGIHMLGYCIVRDTIMVEVLTTPAFAIQILSDDGCAGGDGWAYVYVLHGTGPFSFAWAHGESTQLIENLEPGVYIVIAADNSDPPVLVTDTVVIGAPPPQTTVLFTTSNATNETCDNASISVAVAGGEPPHYFEWRRLGSDDIVSVGQHLLSARAGTYNLTVIDSRGCETVVQIPVQCEHEQLMPSLLITPNADGLNDYLIIHGIEYFPFNTVTIINSFGAEVITIQNYNNIDRRWDGRNSRGNFVPDGTYWFIVQAHGVNPMMGWIIVRLSPGQ